MSTATILLEAGQMKCPITFASMTTTAIVKTEIQKVTDMLVMEDSNESVRPLWIDQMSHPSRVALVSILTAFRAAIP